MLGLYLHIPFCQAICSYCNFNRGLYDDALKARYVPALEQEILHAADVSRPVDTIFFGGGTPSLLDPNDIARLLRACRQAYGVTADAEITLETNPETATLDRLGGFLDAGITRLSFGAQTFDDGELRRLGRVHDAARVGGAVEDARRAGFNNVSLDLMLWLPGQSMTSWRRSVDRAVELAPNHVSLYLLELYPNAPLKEAMARGPVREPGGEWRQVTDDEAADMYLEGLARLDAAGYRQYEISNVALPGYECRHNLKYWTSGNWLGLGCGAHSTVDGHRWQNVASTTDYVARIESGQPVGIHRQMLNDQSRLEEALFTGLRLTAGIDGRRFEVRYGIDPWTVYGDRLQEAADAGLLWRDSTRFGLTREGMLLANEILATFV